MSFQASHCIASKRAPEAVDKIHISRPRTHLSLAALHHSSKMILDPFTMRTILTVGFSCFMTEWLCSFSMEYEYIWKRKWSVLTVAYIGCRYIVFVNVILMMALYYSSWGADYCSPAWVVAPCLSMVSGVRKGVRA